MCAMMEKFLIRVSGELPGSSARLATRRNALHPAISEICGQTFADMHQQSVLLSTMAWFACGLQRPS